jgi:hypothetical protein
MTKVRDILRDSLMLLGAIAPGEALGGEDGQDCLRRLNAMLASWTIEDLMVYTVNRDVYPLTVGVQNYTMGPGGTLSSIRPTQITSWSVIPTASQPDLEIPFDKILTVEEWQNISIKNVPSTYPVYMYDAGDYPARTLSFWPIPTQACSAVLYTWGILSQFSSMDDVVSLPQGYEEAIVYNLAPRLAPMYGKQTSPEVIAMAEGSKSRVKKINVTVGVLRIDSAMCGGNGVGYLAVQSRGYVIDP